MFEQISEPEEHENQKPTDWSGTITAAALLPVFFLFVCMGRAEMGFTVCLVLGLILLAIRLQWKFRKYVWFWATIAVVLAFHIPLFLIVRWPDTKTPTIAYSMPFGIGDFLIISGAIRLSKKLFLKQFSSIGDDQ